MTVIDRPRPRPSDPGPERRPGELGVRELARWTWRQLTSMRTALILLLLLALAAVPGSVIPQEGVDQLKTSNWQAAHPHLTPVYERLGLFSVYSSPWFSAVYILLMISLVGCIVPRLAVYARAIRRPPPAAPRNLTRLPDSTTYTTDETPAEVLARARKVLEGKRYRLRRSDGGAGPEAGLEAVSAERGYLREAGNLLFHVSVLIVLVGFATGSLFGYQGGVIVVTHQSFTNVQSQYDDFNPGSLFTAKGLDPFSLTVDDFHTTYVESGPGRGQQRDFDAPISYSSTPGAPSRTYDLRVNHPLTIDGTSLFLIGHGYAPVITVRDGQGKVTYSGPTVFLPQDQSFLSFGVVKAPFAKPQQIGLQGLLYPTYAVLPNQDPVSIFPRADNPVLSLSVYLGDLGLGSGVPQSVYTLDTTDATQVMNPDNPKQPQQLNIALHKTVAIPGGGSVTFNGMDTWVRLQISKTPGQRVALGGVVLALIGMLGSLFIRPRRVWVRARRQGGVTMVEVAALDRSSGGGGVGPELAAVVAAIGGPAPPDDDDDIHDADGGGASPAAPARPAPPVAHEGPEETA